MNILLLWLVQFEHQYHSPFWLTYRQAVGLGGHIKRGESGVPILFYQKIGEGDEQKMVVRSYTVFNFSQTENVPAIQSITKTMGDVQEFVNRLGPKIEMDHRAYYSPRNHLIRMPPFESFKTEEDYWATLLHELAHWTAPALGRSLAMDKEAYAFEELIAELASAFLCSHFSITPQVRHSDYIAGWAKVLKDDKRAILRASSQAQRIFDYLTGDFYESRLQSDKGTSHLPEVIGTSDTDGGQLPLVPNGQEFQGEP